MKFLPFLTLITLVGAAKSSVINDPPVETELNAYRDRVRIIYSLLDVECPDWRQQNKKNRNFISPEHLEVEKRLYAELIDELIKCRDRNRPRPTEATQTLTTTIPTTTTSTEPTTTTTTPTTTTPTTTSTTPTTTTPTTTTPTNPTTTATTQPIECQSAVTLKGSWRLDHAGQDLRPGGANSSSGYACDLFIKQWFRFSGDGGSKMLSTCPPDNSCGSNSPIWSNATLPANQGERVEATAYRRFGSRCDRFPERLSIIRCTAEPDDVVYFLHRDFEGNICWVSFCGMI